MINPITDFWTQLASNSFAAFNNYAENKGKEILTETLNTSKSLYRPKNVIIKNEIQINYD